MKRNWKHLLSLHDFFDEAYWCSVEEKCENCNKRRERKKIKVLQKQRRTDLVFR